MRTLLKLSFVATILALSIKLSFAGMDLSLDSELEELHSRVVERYSRTEQRIKALRSKMDSIPPFQDSDEIRIKLDDLSKRNTELCRAELYSARERSDSELSPETYFAVRRRKLLEMRQVPSPCDDPPHSLFDSPHAHQGYTLLFENERHQGENELDQLKLRLNGGQKMIFNLQEEIGNKDGQVHFRNVKYRVAAFGFDDPENTGLGDPISFILAKRMLFSTRLSDFAIVSYRQGTAREKRYDLAYFDKVDLIAKDQGFLLAIWGRVSRMGSRIHVDTFVQVPTESSSDLFVKTIRLPKAMGGGRLTARLKPDRILAKSFDLSEEDVKSIREAAAGVATLRESPAVDAPVVGAIATDHPFQIIGHNGQWVRLRARDRQGWTSVNAYCSEECLKATDTAAFANVVLATADGKPSQQLPVDISLQARAFLDQVRSLETLMSDPQGATAVVKHWLLGSESQERADLNVSIPEKAGFANLFAVAKIEAALQSAGKKQNNFDNIKLDRRSIGNIANDLATASVSDPSDLTILDNLAVLYDYLGDDRRRELAVKIADSLRKISYPSRQ